MSEREWYEISFFLGPCSEEEAVEISLEIGSLAAAKIRSAVWMDELKVKRVERREEQTDE